MVSVFFYCYSVFSLFFAWWLIFPLSFHIDILIFSNIPPYFEYKESPCISYSYTSSVATKIFNYKTSLQQIDFQSLSQNPLPCSCSGSEFLYAPCGHIVTGDLNIVRNDKLRDLLRKGPKYREPVSFSWHQNFDIIMDACEAYARRWAKKEDVELDTLSEWI